MPKKKSLQNLPNVFADTLRDLASWLEAEEIPQTIIGGVAVAMLWKARVTQDVDAVIWLDTSELEAFLKTGERHGFLPRISDAADFARLKRVLLLKHQPTGVAVDLSCGALPFESEMIARARTITVGLKKIKVATPEDLIIMKAVACRPKDIADIEAITDIESNLDLERIRFWVEQFAEALEMPELMTKLESILRR